MESKIKEIKTESEISDEFKTGVGNEIFDEELEEDIWEFEDDRRLDPRIPKEKGFAPIGEYIKAEEELTKLEAEHTIMRERQHEETDALDHKYWELKRELDDKKVNEEHKLAKCHEREEEIISKQEYPHVVITHEHSRIMKMMEISKNYEKPEFKVYKSDYPIDEKEISYTPIDTVKDDKYAKIQIFITDSGKPKNKFSLAAVGHTIFPGEIIKLPYNYGYNFRCRDTNIIMSMRDRPTKEELKAYYERNGKGILKQFLADHKKIEQEYENIIANTDSKQWEIAYWNNKKDYYEKHYNRGTEAPEYKHVLEKLSALV